MHCIDVNLAVSILKPLCLFSDNSNAQGTNNTKSTSNSLPVRILVIKKSVAASDMNIAAKSEETNANTALQSLCQNYESDEDFDG